jgi:hypothetical protein
MHWKVMMTCVVCALFIAMTGKDDAIAFQALQATAGFVDMTARFGATGNGDALKREYPVMRKGRRANATVLIAPATVRASLAGFGGKGSLKILAAPVFNVGDGMRMDLTLLDAGERRPIYSRYFDAGRKAEDRAWIAIEVPLDLRGSGDVYLEIQVSGGPQGDLVADWLAFAEVLMASERTVR